GRSGVIVDHYPAIKGRIADEQLLSGGSVDLQQHLAGDASVGLSGSGRRGVRGLHGQRCTGAGHINLWSGESVLTGKRIVSGQFGGAGAEGVDVALERGFGAGSARSLSSDGRAETHIGSSASGSFGGFRPGCTGDFAIQIRGDGAFGTLGAASFSVDIVLQR